MSADDGKRTLVKSSAGSSSAKRGGGGKGCGERGPGEPHGRRRRIFAATKIRTKARSPTLFGFAPRDCF